MFCLPKTAWPPTWLAVFNQHTTQYGYMIPPAEDATSTLNSVFDQIMALFK